MAELLRVENLSAGYGEARVIHGLEFRSRGRPVAGAARAQRRRQDDAHRFADRRHHPLRRHASRSPARTSPPLPPYLRARRGVGWTPQERNIFRSLTVEENLTAVAIAGSVDG